VAQTHKLNKKNEGVGKGGCPREKAGASSGVSRGTTLSSAKIRLTTTRESQRRPEPDKRGEAALTGYKAVCEGGGKEVRKIAHELVQVWSTSTNTRLKEEKIQYFNCESEKGDRSKTKSSLEEEKQPGREQLDFANTRVLRCADWNGKTGGVNSGTRSIRNNGQKKPQRIGKEPEKKDFPKRSAWQVMLKKIAAREGGSRPFAVRLAMEGKDFWTGVSKVIHHKRRKR